LEKKITFIPLDEIRPFVPKAEAFSPDPADITYLALALKLNIPLWSNDKALKKTRIC